MNKSIGGVRKLIVGRQDLLALAQQGDESAIATLINYAAQQKGITATVSLKGNCLHVLLASASQVPHQPSCIRFIDDGLRRLKAGSIESVWVYGQQSNQNAYAWIQVLDLRETVDSTPTASDRNPPTPQTSQQLKPLLIKEETGEIPAPQPKLRKTKLRTKYRKRISLVLLGSMSWVLIATTGYIIGSQLDSQVASTSKKSSPHSVNLKVGSVSEKTATFITIKAVGDIVPGSSYSRNRLLLSKQESLLFKDVLPYLKGADILFGNFESTLTNYPNTTKDTSRPMVVAFRTPPAYAQLLKATGFDILNVANNHSMDFSSVGFADTLKNIENAGIKYVGKKNQILYFNIKNIPVAFIGFSFLSEHNSMHDLKAAKALVETAKKRAEIVMISVHAGAEGTDAVHVRNQEEFFYGENRGNMVLFAHSMIDCGADLIPGHGPHVSRAIELYKGKLIAYSLGNFLGDGALSTREALGSSMILQVQLNSNGDFVSGNIIPMYLDNQGIPHYDKQFRSVQMIRNLTKSDFPKTPMTIDKQGQILK